MQFKTTRQVNSGWFGRCTPRALFSIVPVIFLLGIWPLPHSKIIMRSSQSVPAAKGVIHASHDDNKNIKLEMNVQYLAQPGALTPPAAAYVVWLQPENDSAQNKGELKIDKNRNGNLTIVTPLKRFEIYITPEQSTQATAPTGEHVLSANVSQD